jgi:transcriptional regulator with GAF, ATPase, and Fis domain
VEGSSAHVEFERLVAQVSSNFINLPLEAVDDAIRDALRRVGEMLHLDRCAFYSVREDGMLVDSVSWHRDRIPPGPVTTDAASRFPWAISELRAGRTVTFARPSDIPSAVDRESYEELGIRAAVVVPLSVGGRIVGGVNFNVFAERQWDADTVRRLEVIRETFASVLARRQHEQTLRRALDEVRRLTGQLQAENSYLRGEVRAQTDAPAVIGNSAAVRRVLELVGQVARTDATVLLLGETGTGKELFANEIHRLSARSARAMVRVNCSAIPSTLIESELFGRERGAFTGADSRQIGRFELADQSTIFLDEIGELPAEVQVKLLRVLEERQIERLGSPRPIKVNTRIIAATHRNLQELIKADRFRADLFYRLNVFPIQVPPLRERVEDIPGLARLFAAEFAKQFGKVQEPLSDESLAALQSYSWPGNIRELRNVIEREVILARGSRLSITLPSTPGAAQASARTLDDLQSEHIRAVLESTGWRIRGAGGAAERLGLKPTTLETRLLKLGIRRPTRA